MILNIVPRPGFCLKKSIKVKQQHLQIKLLVPMDKLDLRKFLQLILTRVKFPVVDKINKPSPKPKIVNPKIKKNDVENFGLKFKLF